MKLNTREWGTGDRIAVLVHGIMSDSRTWRRVGPALAERGYRVVAVDLRGHGASGPADEYPNEAYGADIIETIAALGGVDLVIGHSLGGPDQEVGHSLGGAQLAVGQSLGGVDQEIGDSLGGAQPAIDHSIGGADHEVGHSLGGVDQAAGHSIGGADQEIGDSLGGARLAVGHSLGGVDLVIGHSLGGRAVLLAVEAGWRPAKAVYVDPAWRLSRPEDGFDPARFVEFADHATYEAIAALAPRWEPEDIEIELATLAVWDRRTALESSKHAVAALDAGTAGDGTGLPLRADVPSLIMLADQSQMINALDAETLRQRGFELRTVPEAGHSIHRDDLAGFMAALEGWI